ncbi:MAG: hypothetical protein ACOY4L_07525 [Pseudomonadota bacterium]
MAGKTHWHRGFAAGRADALLDHLDTLAMHAHRDILDDWVCIPACEWDAVMAQVCEGETHER